MHCKIQVQKLKKIGIFLSSNLTHFGNKLEEKKCKISTPIGIVVGIIFEKGQHSFMQLDEEMVQWYNKFTVE
jgi:hypothetical protein